MGRRRFYAAPEDIAGSIINLPAEETHHLRRVLRLRPGDEASVFDGRGREYQCRLLSEKGGRARLEIIAELKDIVESSLRLTLAQAVAKGEKFDFIIQKATELGVTAIAPLVTDHTDVKPGRDQMGKRLERWRRISLEALKQCGRRRLVEIAAPVTVEQLLDSYRGLSNEGSILHFSEKGGVAITEALVDRGQQSSILVVVGPEGGWSDGELGLLAERGSKAVTLGPRVLRTETAAVVAVALAQHFAGDLSSSGNRH